MYADCTRGTYHIYRSACEQAQDSPSVSSKKEKYHDAKKEIWFRYASKGRQRQPRQKVMATSIQNHERAQREGDQTVPVAIIKYRERAGKDKEKEC